MVRDDIAPAPGPNLTRKLSMAKKAPRGSGSSSGTQKSGSSEKKSDPDTEATPLPPAPAASVPRDKILWVSIVVLLALLGSYWWLHFQGSDRDPNSVQQRLRRQARALGPDALGADAMGPGGAAAEAKQLKVTVYDRIAPPEGPIQVAAKYETDHAGFINPDRKELPVVLGMHGEQQTITGDAITDRDGIAKSLFTAPKTPGQYQLFTHPVQNQGKFELRQVHVVPLLFVVPKNQPLLVCDLDGTVTDGESLFVDKVKPLPDAARVLRRLSEQYQIIYITARDEGLLDRSRAWLEQYEFPRAPVICRDWTLTNLGKTGAYKKRVLTDLRNHFSGFRWGIGNSKGDREAYQSGGFPYIIVGDKTGISKKANGEFEFEVESWKSVEEIIFGSNEATPKK